MIQLKTPKDWYDAVKDYIDNSEDAYAVSWHLRLEWDIPTAHINYHLTKLANHGYLRKQTSCNWSKYYLTDKPFKIALPIKQSHTL